MHLFKAELVPFVILSICAPVVIDFAHIYITLHLVVFILILERGVFWVFLLDHIQVDDNFLVTV